jgi:hypothetical protein
MKRENRKMLQNLLTNFLSSTQVQKSKWMTWPLLGQQTLWRHYKMCIGWIVAWIKSVIGNFRLWYNRSFTTSVAKFKFNSENLSLF